MYKMFIIMVIVIAGKGCQFELPELESPLFLQIYPARLPSYLCAHRALAVILKIINHH